MPCREGHAVGTPYASPLTLVQTVAVRISVRVAEASDADQLKPVHLASCEWGYREFFPPQLLDQRLAKRRELDWAERVSAEVPRRQRPGGQVGADAAPASRSAPRHDVDLESGQDVLDQLRDRCRRDHHAWINGDAAGYALPEDGTIMGAVGGYSRGGAATADRQRAVAAQWRSGTGDIEFLNGGLSGDMAWLVFIERATVVFAGDTHGAEHRWDLRVTEVFRRVGAAWERVHRQADPLVEFRPLGEVAALLD